MAKNIEEIKNKVDLENLIQNRNLIQIEKELESNKTYNVDNALSFIYTSEFKKMKINKFKNIDEVFIIKLIDLFIKYGANINHDDGSILKNWSGTPSVKIVKHLLSNGANIDAKKFRENALTSAINNKQFEVLKLLIEKGANTDDNEINLLALCANNEDFDMLNYLINIGCNSQANKDVALISSVYTSNIKMIKFLIKKEANIHAYNDEVICVAARYGNKDIIDLLINSGVDIKTQNNTPLINAIKNEDLDVAKILIQYGSDVDIAIREAIYTQNGDFLEWCQLFKSKKILELTLNKDLKQHESVKRVKI